MHVECLQARRVSRRRAEPDESVGPNQYRPLGPKTGSRRIAAVSHDLEERPPPPLEIRQSRLVDSSEERQVVAGSAEFGAIRVALAGAWSQRASCEPTCSPTIGLTT